MVDLVSDEICYNDKCKFIVAKQKTEGETVDEIKEKYTIILPKSTKPPKYPNFFTTGKLKLKKSYGKIKVVLKTFPVKLLTNKFLE